MPYLGLDDLFRCLYGAFWDMKPCFRPLRHTVGITYNLKYLETFSLEISERVYRVCSFIIRIIQKRPHAHERHFHRNVRPFFHPEVRPFSEARSHRFTLPEAVLSCLGVFRQSTRRQRDEWKVNGKNEWISGVLAIHLCLRVATLR